MSAAFALVLAAWAATGPAPSAPGPVGVRVVDIAGTQAWLWYPAAAPPPGPAVQYDYEVTVFAALGPLTIGRFGGTASPGAAPAPSPAPRPLVVLEPGHAIGPAAYAWLAEPLAARGLVVVAPTRPGSLFGAEDELWQAAVTRPAATARFVAAARAWFADKSGRRPAVADDKVAVIGHSLGGHAALAAGGARLDPAAFAARCAALDEPAAHPGGYLCAVFGGRTPDMAALVPLPPGHAGPWPATAVPGVRAVVALAGDAYLYDRAGLAGVRVPVLAVGGTADRDTPYAWGTGLVAAHVRPGLAHPVALPGAGHMVFTARCAEQPWLVGLVPFGFCDPDEDRRAIQRQVADAVMAFLAPRLFAGERPVRP